MAQYGQFRELAQQYEQDLAEAEAAEEVTARLVPGQMQDDEEAFQQVNGKAKGHALRAAKQILMVATRPPLTETTAREVHQLVAIETPSGE